jgi:magnesium-transporting ATPase (P-type)
MNKGEEGKLKVQAEALSKLNTGDFQYHKKLAEDVIKQLTTNEKTGLTQAEAEKRLKEYGPNELDKEEEESLWEKIKEQFEDILVRILLLSAIISFVFAVTGDDEEGLTAYVEPFVILLILILNSIVSIW